MALKLEKFMALSNAANCVLVFVCLKALSNKSCWLTKMKNFFYSTLRDYCIAFFKSIFLVLSNAANRVCVTSFVRKL